MRIRANTTAKNFLITLALFAFVNASAAELTEKNGTNEASSADCTDALTRINPLLEDSKLPHGAIPFDRIRLEDFEPAFEVAFAQASAEIQIIRNNRGKATFANTIEALEKSGALLSKVDGVFSHWSGVRGDDALIELEQKITPRISNFNQKTFSDRKLFARVAAVYRSRNELALTPEQQMLVTKTYRAFVHTGVALSRMERRRLGAIRERLSVLGDLFNNNVKAVVKSFIHVVTDPAQLKGLPPAIIRAAADLAEKKGHKDSYAFSLQAPSFFPILEYGDDRNLREVLWRAYSSRANGGAHDNRPVLLEIAKLRQETAQLFGFSTYADFALQDRMAKNQATVEKFLHRLAGAYLPTALIEKDQLEGFAGHRLEPWDIYYYEEKLKEKRYGFNEEELRPYLQLDNVIAGAMDAATRRYGVTFVQKTNIPTWHPSVRAYEVYDRGGMLLALYYVDPFPRDEKNQGAWNLTFQSASGNDSLRQPAFVVNVLNARAPVGDMPSLLSMGEATTFFHELGHGLHAMLTRTQYGSLAGTSVARDFVELPSQLNEEWATAPELLARFALHYQTQEPMPPSLIQKMRDAKNFHSGINGIAQVRMGLIDLAWNGRDLSHLKNVDDIAAWELDAIRPYRILIGPPASVTSTAFTHIFSGGYAAGYYGYKWADVLAADAFEEFQKNGLFDPATSERFLKEILEKGGTEDAAELYRRFKGRDPNPDALLKREGIPVEE